MDNLNRLVSMLGIVTGSFVMGSIVKINLDKSIQEKKEITKFIDDKYNDL